MRDVGQGEQAEEQPAYRRRSVEAEHPRHVGVAEPAGAEMTTIATVKNRPRWRQELPAAMHDAGGPHHAPATKVLAEARGRHAGEEDEHVRRTLGRSAPSRGVTDCRGNARYRQEHRAACKEMRRVAPGWARRRIRLRARHPLSSHASGRNRQRAAGSTSGPRVAPYRHDDEVGQPYCAGPFRRARRHRRRTDAKRRYEVKEDCAACDRASAAPITGSRNGKADRRDQPIEPVPMHEFLPGKPSQPVNVVNSQTLPGCREFVRDNRRRWRRTPPAAGETRETRRNLAIPFSVVGGSIVPAPMHAHSLRPAAIARRDPIVSMKPT